MVRREDYLSREQIKVTTEGSLWRIEGRRRSVLLDALTFRVEVQSPVTNWRMIEACPNDLLIGCDGGEFTRSFTEAGFREVTHYDTGTIGGVMIHLKDFPNPAGGVLDLELRLFITMEIATEEILFQIVPSEKTAVIRECRWPKMLQPQDIDVTVVPNMQGVLIPKNFGPRIVQYDDRMYGRGFYMPWWGFQKGRSAAIVIVETPADAKAKVEHDAGGPTKVELQWMNQLGRMSYPRRIRFCDFDEGNYVTLCKRYRRYVMEAGKFVSLREKITRNPKVEHLVGAPLIHTSILYHMEPSSSYYNKEDLSKNHMLVTFDERIEHLRKLHAMGVKKAYLHLDGWGYRGYDNFHPDHLPPNEEAGGWEGMKRFADACRELNYLFAIHDQYRDYYHDGPAYDARHEVWLDAAGKRHYETTWPGGPQGLLCSSLSPLAQARNHRALRELGMDIRGAYLDVFAVNPPDECYNPEHPVTRRECLENWSRCFSLVRSILGVASSEEPCDWAVPHLDLVHHGPYPLIPNPGKGPANGIPVPLFNLVYHDAIILPWSLNLDAKGAWGVPDSDSSLLHITLNAGMPYISLEPSEKELTAVKQLCALQQKLAFEEMVNHEFLDDTYRRQRVTYSDGTTITADFDKDQLTITPEIAG